MAQMTRQEIDAAVAAVSQGQLPQMRILVDGILGRVEELEKSSGGQQSGGGLAEKLSSVEEAEAPADDAKSVDVRESVIALTEKFNQVLTALKE